MMHGATTSRTSHRTARHHPQSPDMARGLHTSAGLSARAPRRATRTAQIRDALAPVTTERRAEDADQVAAVIRRLRHSRGWICICDERSFHRSGRRAVVRAPRILLGALGAQGSDIPQHPPEGASP
jgi:hypothetical protein